MVEEAAMSAVMMRMEEKCIFNGGCRLWVLIVWIWV